MSNTTSDAHVNTEVTVLYFASLAQQLGCAKESVEFAPELNSVARLQQWLIGRGAPWHALTSDRVRCAVNQEIVKPDHPIRPGDEVAFFPPVTGG